MLNRNKLNFIYILLLLLSIVILRLPLLYVWDNHLTGDDAALYMDTAINLAEGKGYYADLIQLHINDKDYLERYVKKNGVKDRMEWIPPLYISFLSAIYLITGLDRFLLGINILNFSFFILFLFLYFKYLKMNFADNFQVMFLSFFFIGLNFMIFEFTFGAHMESLYLLTFFIVFLLHIKLIEKTEPKFYHYLLYSIALSLFLFSKYAAIPFVAAFIFHHAFRKDFKSFFLSATLTFLIIAPWMFVRSYIISGHPLSIFIHGPFPFRDLPEWTGFGTKSIYSIYSYLREISHIFNWYLSIDYFFFLLPFALAFLLNKKGMSGIIRKSMLVLLIFSFSFFAIIYNSSVARYQFLLIIPLMPYAINELLTFLKSNKRSINLKAYLIILLIVFGGIQLVKITEFYNFARKRGIEQSVTINESIQLVDRHRIGTDKIILANILGFNVFSQNTIVLPPRNMTEKNKNELFEVYQIDYVLFGEGESYLSNNIFGDLELIGSSNRGRAIFLYKVEHNL